MPYGPDGNFTLTQSFGTGTAPNNDFPPQVGNTLNDIASSIAISNIFSQASTAGSIAASLSSLVLGTPTGGNKGVGTLNAQGIYENNNEVFSQTGTASGGLVITPFSFGTVSTSTIAPSPAVCLKQNVTYNGTLTVSAPTLVGDIELLVTNGTAAASVALSGFSKQFSGDSFTTVSGSSFVVFIYGFGSKTACIVKALQ